MHTVVALEGRRQPEWTPEQKAVYAVVLSLRDEGGRISALGLSRWILKNPDLTVADAKIAAAAEWLWHGMLLMKDEDDAYSAP
jgi:hypothetical protein